MKTYRTAFSKLSKHQKKLVIERVKDRTATIGELGVRAGYVSSPRQHAWRSLQTSKVKQAICDLMDQHPELQDFAIMKGVAEGTKAMETKFFTHEGRVIESEECIDYPTRKQYLELAAKMKGFVGNGHGEEAGQTNIFLTLNDSQLALIASGKANPLQFIQAHADPTSR